MSASANDRQERGTASTASPIAQVVTFAGAPFRGNPAFVLTLDRPRPLALLQDVCRELREIVLAVVTVGGEGFDLRFVTQRGTHSGPGHATHAAAHVASGRLGGGAAFDFRLEGGGRRRVALEDGLIAVEWPLMAFAPAEAAGVAAALGRTPRETFTSAFGLVAVLDDPAEVAALAPDLGSLAALPFGTVMVTAPGEGADFVLRVFAPKLDLPEDPVCGTAHRILVPYWSERFGRSALVSHQLSPRGGVLRCRLGAGTVMIAGEAVTFLDGTVELPA